MLINGTTNISSTLNSAVYNEAGKCEITGGEITSESNNNPTIYNNDEVIITNANVSSTSNSAIYNNEAGKCTISGGEITSQSDSSPTIYNNCDSSTYKDSQIIINNTTNISSTLNSAVYNETGKCIISGGKITSESNNNPTIYNTSEISIANTNISSTSNLAVDNDSNGKFYIYGNATIDTKSDNTVAIKNIGYFSFNSDDTSSITLNSNSDAIENNGNISIGHITINSNAKGSVINNVDEVNIGGYAPGSPIGGGGSSSFLVALINSSSNEPVINNTGTVNISAGIITSTGDSGYVIKSNSTEASVIISEYSSIKGANGIRTNGTLVSNGKIEATNGNAIEFAKGTINIRDGAVTGNNCVYNSGADASKTLIIGNESAPVDTTKPTITATNTAVDNGTDTFIANFYDGAVTGSTQFKEQAEVNVPEGYEIVVNDKTATLAEIAKGEYGTNGNTEDGVSKVNPPNIMPGMKAIKFKEDGTSEKTTTSDPEWYAYKESKEEFGTDNTTSHWANAETADGSQWVWIPRYAYKITNPGTSTANQIDIIFLKGTSDKYEDENEAEQDLPEDYIVHSAFTDETDTQFANGGWDEELTGIWVAKYEASKGTGIESQSKQTYPKFVPGQSSYGDIKIGEVFTLCKNLNQSGNPYGFSSSKVDTHQMKNSEWGAVAYLAQSKYGRNGVEVQQNKVNSSGTKTGYGASSSNTYNTPEGQKASTTGNIYGIYDMSGGASEFTAGYQKGGTSNLTKYGQSLVDETSKNNNGNSTKYVSVYEGDNYDENINYNDATNSKRKGEAIWETSTSGTEHTSWFGDASYFSYTLAPFLLRGGSYNNSGASAGLFYFFPDFGYANSFGSFRAVWVSL